MSTNEFKLPQGGKDRIKDGMRVPQGYFEAFNRSMCEKLPFNQAAESPRQLTPVHRTWWQKARPYIYMAAMFAGVWCMTKMFSLMKTENNSLSLTNNATITAALNNNDFYEDYVLSSTNEYDILDNLYEEGCDLSDFHFSTSVNP